MNVKTERIHLNVTEEEKEIIDDFARVYGMSRSEFLRKAVMSFSPENEDDLHTKFLICCEKVHKLTEKPFSNSFYEDAVEILGEIEDVLIQLHLEDEFLKSG